MCKRLHIHAICLRTHIIKHMIISVICTNMRKGNKFYHLSFSPKAAAMWAKFAMEKLCYGKTREDERIWNGL